MLESRSLRWKSSPAFDADVFWLTDGRWLVFAYVKDERLASDESAWRALAAELSASSGGAPVAAVARALKVDKRSEPLAPIAITVARGDDDGVFWCREGWTKYRLESRDVLNPGLFLDQLVNRHRLLALVQEFIAASRGQFGEEDGVLNLFSYTGSFSIAALAAGARATTSVDVSARYLAWEKENFDANFGGHDQLSHRLIKDDARDFLRRAAKKGARYRWIVIDPPTFSRGQGKAFKIQDDFLPLVEDAVACLTPGGAILASGNDARWEPRAFFGELERLAARHRLKIEPGGAAPGFPPEHPLKSAWLFSGG